jgi:hypothetical protein
LPNGVLVSRNIAFRFLPNVHTNALQS